MDKSRGLTPQPVKTVFKLFYQRVVIEYISVGTSLLWDILE